MPKGVYQRKKEPMEAPEQTAESPESPPSSFEDTMLTLLQQMSAQITALGERVEAVEQKPTGFMQPPIDANTAATDRSRQALAGDPDGIPKSQTIPLFPNGQRVPDLVMDMYRPKFGSGSMVLLNPDAVPHGRNDGRTRGELMAEKGVPNGYGVVLDRTYLSAQQGVGWKYRVKFDKAVMPGSNGGIVFLHEQELLHA
jgi:hypothetical protein